MVRNREVISLMPTPFVVGQDNKGIVWMSRAFKNSILGSFAGTAGRLTSLPFEGRRPHCRPSHWRSGIDGRKSRYWLLQMLFVEAADQTPTC